MSLFGGGASTKEPAIGSFKVMSQGFGVTVPVVIGTNRVQCTLIDYLDLALDGVCNPVLNVSTLSGPAKTLRNGLQTHSSASGTEGGIEV